VPLPGDHAHSTVAQAVSGVGADPKTRGAFGFGPVSGRHRTQIHTLGHDHLGDVLQHAHLSTDPAQPKDSARTTDPVVAHHVPVSTQIDDPPRLHLTPLRHRLGRFAVVEEYRTSVTYRLPDRAEGRFVRAHRRGQARGRLGVHRHPRRLPLEQGLGCGLPQSGVPPGPGGQSQYQRLVRQQLDLGQPVVATDDAVTLLTTEGITGADPDRDTAVPQFSFVPLEHALEGLFGFDLGITLDRFANLL